MEMPAWLLEMGNFHYPGIDSLSSQQVKPPAVAETEFRLADGMLSLRISWEAPTAAGWPEDLLSDASNTRDKLRAAENERAILSLRRDALISGRQDIKALEKAAVDAGNALRSKKARNKMDAVKALTDDNKNELSQALENAFEPPLKLPRWTSLTEMQSKCLKNQVDVMTANDSLSNAQLAASKAYASGRPEPHGCGLAVTRMVPGEDGKPKAEKTEASKASAPLTTPVAPDTQDSASIWQWFVIDSEKSKSTSTKLSKTAVSHSDWSAGLWFASGSGHRDSASSENTKKVTTPNTHVQIGFRAMKVTIDRPWFEGQLLGQTKEFFYFKRQQYLGRRSARDTRESEQRRAN
ncbi:hypothetical protein QBC43DRAFT_287644 [Cladorrhinum sp. PSN259]|nr:hypothetical protein QBC43DRAFT_287644 [Cladorrhinum sp. PSN259]